MKSRSQLFRWLKEKWGTRERLRRKKVLNTLIRDMQSRQELSDLSFQMLSGALKLEELRARDIMTPEPRLALLKLGDKPERVEELFVESQFSRYPVINDEGAILGVFLMKDYLLMRLLNGNKASHVAVEAYIRRPLIIPESRRSIEVLRDLRANKDHMAIVLDEYGKLSGVVTIEDILEEVVGEIEDEHDDEAGRITLMEGRSDTLTFRVVPEVELSELNRELGLNLKGPSNTLSGWILDQLEYLPQSGERLQADGAEVEILSADDRKINTILLRLPKAPPGANGQSHP